MFQQLDSENKHIRLQPFPHALWNLQDLIYIQEIDYDHWAAILRELKSNF